MSDNDRILSFTLPAEQVRGRLVRFGPLADSILAAHAYPPWLKRLLAEALALAALVGGLLTADDGELTLQVRGEDGPVRLLVADYRQGAVRGYAAVDLDRRFPLPEKPQSLRDSFGNGQLVLTIDRPGGERYQGIVELDARSLAHAAGRYFERSEQVPTLLRLAAAPSADGWRVGGLLVQRLPDAAGNARFDEAGWEVVNALAASVADDELLNPALSFSELLWRLFHEHEVRLQEERPLERGCRCSVTHIRDVLLQFPEEERAAMRNSSGKIVVDCEFCARQFHLSI